MGATLLTLREALNLAMALSNRRSSEVREELRRALLDGVVRAEGNVERRLYVSPRWERVGREFWTSMPDWSGNTATTSADEQASDIHVARPDIERLFDPAAREASTAIERNKLGLWRLGGVEKTATSDRGWLLPDALREFFPTEYGRWHAAAFRSVGDREDAANDLALLGLAIRALRLALRSGELLGSGLIKGGKVVQIPASHWERLNGRMLFEFSLSSLVGADFRYSDVRVRESVSSRSSIRTEKRCEEWFLSRVGNKFEPTSRAAMLEEARREVDPALSERAFLRVWGRHAPEAWKRSGVKKPNRRT